MATVLPPLLIAAVSTLAALGVLPAPEFLLWVLRLGLAAAGVKACAALIRSANPIAVVGPLPLLAVISGVAFSIVPALYTGVELAIDGNVRYERSLWFLGTRAELLIIQFSALTLAAATWTSTFLEPAPIPGRLFEANAARFVPVVVVVALALSALYLAVHRGEVMPTLAGTRFGRDILDATPPVLSLLTATAATALAQRFTPRRVAYLALALALMAITLYVGRHHNKMTVYAAVVAIGYVALYHRGLPHRLMTIAVSAAAAVVLVSLTAIGNWQRIDVHQPHLYVLLGAVAYKFIFRQTDTGACLEGVLREHFDDLPTAGVMSLLAGLIPAYVWPDKPSLSSGALFAVRYCGYPEETMRTLNAGHSASITLLGDTLIYGGLAGYALGVALLLALLAALTIYCSRRGTSGTIALVALTPWLIDFDQHYPLYLAVVVKNLLYMLPFLYLVRRAKTARAL